jgi:hypothetical protein
MRYAAISAIGLALAFSLPGSKALGADVSIEAGVSVGVGGELNIGYFHDQLAPHGQWVETADYGRAWQPKEVLVDADWRPYVDNGHWVYTDAGWYWDSSYAWGWAAFHYGRWNQDAHYRWLWTPDVTWAPAWVSWRHSDSVYGWAPLPYGSRFEGGVLVGANLDIRAESYSFVPAYSFLSVNLSTVAIDRERVPAAYKQTTVVNNSYTYNDNRVINNGIPLKQVATATKQEIKPTSIVEAKSPATKGEAGKINAYRPTIKNETPKTPPTAAAADKKEAGTKVGTTQPKAGTAPTVPASYVKEESAADSKKGAAEAKTEPKAVVPNSAKVDAKTEPKAVEPGPAKVDTKATEPKAVVPGPAKADA